jgi:hypothetical protein
MFGAQFGSIATAYVRGPAIRYLLSYSLGLAALGAGIPLLNLLTGGAYPILTALAVMLTLGQMFFLCLFIMSMVLFALRHNRGMWVPDWVLPLLVSSAEMLEQPTAVHRELRKAGQI